MPRGRERTSNAGRSSRSNDATTPVRGRPISPVAIWHDGPTVSQANLEGHDSHGTQRVLLVGGAASARRWVELALRETEFRSVGEAEDAAEAVALSTTLKPHVFLIEAAGVGPVTAMRDRNVSSPMVLMTPSPQRGFNENAREAGAQGTLVRTGSVQALLAVLRRVARGDESFDPRHPQRPPGQRELSPRERDVLRLVARGATNREIAGELGLGQETVKTLLARSCAKLGVHRRRDAAIAARGLGLL
jgi:DNA-binding NarL/FixJ family response regulator